jgi:hypothetical protein
VPRIRPRFEIRDFGEAHAYVILPDGRIDTRTFNAFDWQSNWSIVRTFRAGGNSFLFLLNTPSGDVRIHALLADGSVGGEIGYADWPSGWTTATFYEVGGRTFLLLLRQDTGLVHIHPVRDDGLIGDRLESHDFSAGWTTAEVFSVGTITYLFLLKRSEGTVHVHRFRADGRLGARAHAIDWSSGWNTAVFYRAGTDTCLFLLRESNGLVHTHRMRADGAIGDQIETFDWSSGWTTVMPFEAGGQSRLLLLKESDGHMHVDAIRDDGTIGDRIEDRRQGLSGWTSAAWWQSGGKAFLFLNMKGRRRPLRRVFIEHLVLGVPSGLYVTDDRGRLVDNNRDEGLDSFTDYADLRVLCHNSVVRAPNGPIDHWVDFPGVRDLETHVIGGPAEQRNRFRVINRAAEAYDRVFRQFEPFATRGEFPLGQPTSLSEGRDRARRLELMFPDAGPQPLAFVEPKGLTTGFPVVHMKAHGADQRLFGGNGRYPTLVPGELAHALHFSLLTEAQRDQLAAAYVRFIVADWTNQGKGTHELDKITDPTVAFVEALDHFATEFTIFRIRFPSVASGSAARRAFIEDQLARDVVGTISGPLETGTITPKAGIAGSSIEGAVYGAIFLDLARRTRIGLSRAVRAFFDSKATTFGQFRTWVDANRPEMTPALDEVSTTWNM